MKYNKKEFVKSDGRQLTRGGPRDMQRRQRQEDMFGDSAITSVLREEIVNLKNELSNHSTVRGTGEFTAEQVDEEINKVVTATIKELTNKHDAIVKELKTRIASLSMNDSNSKQKVMLSKKDHEIDLKELKSEIATQKEQLESKEAIIRELKEALASGEVRVSVPMTDPGRPQMEQVFIDPLEKGAGSDLVSHITIEDVSIDEKEKMDEKVNKLRNILGGRTIRTPPDGRKF